MNKQTSHDTRASAARKPGRPLSFDREVALEKAMLLFWRHGYEATSLNDLTSELGVKPPSIYAAFGDKKRLFFEAVDRYLLPSDELSQRIGGAVDAREAACVMLEAAVIKFTGEHTPPGCLLASAAISCSPAAAEVAADLRLRRTSRETELRGRIEADIADGRLAHDTDADALAGLIMSTIQGLSTLARDGADRSKLMRIAKMVMASWPKPPSAPVCDVGGCWNGLKT